MRPLAPLALCLTIALAAPAGAQNRVVPVFGGGAPPVPDAVPTVAGPFLSGEDVVFAERRRNVIAVVADGPGGRRDVHASTRDVPSTPRVFALDVAEGWAGLTSYTDVCVGDLQCSKYNPQSREDFRTVAGP